MTDKQESLLDCIEFLSSSEEEEQENENQNEIEDENVGKMKKENNTTGCMKSELTIHNNFLSKEERNSKEKINQIITLIKQLQTHVVSLEKEKKSLLYRKLNAETKSSDYRELEMIEAKQNKELCNEKKQLATDINRISTKIHKFKRDKENMQKCASYIEKLRVCIEDIESNIMHFKEKQRLTYEEIASEETSLTKEIELYVKKFEQWSKTTKDVKQYRNKFEENNQDIQLPKEIEDFEVFLQTTGGHQGGWDDIDHQTFLKLRKQLKNDDKLLVIAEGEIPTRSVDEIVSYINWYKEYCFLRENKREAIKRWKISKEAERQGVLSNVAQTLDDPNEKSGRKLKVLQKEREERFEKLKQWKIEKAEKELNKNRSKEDENEEMKIKQIIEERRKFETKLKVQRYKEQKQEEKLILERAREQKSKEEKIIITEEELHKIKERNDKIAATKKQQIINKQKENEEKQRRLENIKRKVVVNVKRDPSRLYQLTEGCKNRREDKDKSVVTNNGVNAQFIPHRAVPSWRRGAP